MGPLVIAVASKPTITNSQYHRSTNASILPTQASSQLQDKIPDYCTLYHQTGKTESSHVSLAPRDLTTTQPRVSQMMPRPFHQLLHISFSDLQLLVRTRYVRNDDENSSSFQATHGDLLCSSWQADTEAFGAGKSCITAWLLPTSLKLLCCFPSDGCSFGGLELRR